MEAFSFGRSVPASDYMATMENVQGQLGRGSLADRPLYFPLLCFFLWLFLFPSVRLSLVLSALLSSFCRSVFFNAFFYVFSWRFYLCSWSLSLSSPSSSVSFLSFHPLFPLTSHPCSSPPLFLWHLSLLIIVFFFLSSSITLLPYSSPSLFCLIPSYIFPPSFLYFVPGFVLFCSNKWALLLDQYETFSLPSSSLILISSLAVSVGPDRHKDFIV